MSLGDTLAVASPGGVAPAAFGWLRSAPPFAEGIPGCAVVPACGAAGWAVPLAGAVAAGAAGAGVVVLLWA